MRRPVWLVVFLAGCASAPGGVVSPPCSDPAYRECAIPLARRRPEFSRAELDQLWAVARFLRAHVTWKSTSKPTSRARETSSAI